METWLSGRKLIERLSVEKMCLLNLKAVIENPLQIFTIKVEIEDINDNAPSFSKKYFEVEISESALSNARFALGYAQDSDIGTNSVQGYSLSENEYFILGEKANSDGHVYPELVLERPLDREKQSTIELSLTASDGGNPRKTGTALIKIVVLDANDNYPMFTQDTYQVALSENAPNGFLVIQLKATDEDDGSNAQITYSFSHISEKGDHIFQINAENGEIQKIGELDYEVTKNYKITVEAKDGGGLFSYSEVSVQVIDANDNTPEIQINSFLSVIPEDSPPETVIALINIHDLDSGENGEVVCQITETLPFQLISLTESYYKIVTLSRMDREIIPDYNITIIAKDKGTPSLSSTKTIQVILTDVNDNIPIFEKTYYVAYVPENNLPGMAMLRVNAVDRDTNENGQVVYSIIHKDIQDISISSHISINSGTGVIYALHGFDYEQMREFQFQVMAKDSGIPSLSSNATIRVCIIDKNDNSPRILYPSSDTEGTVVYELIPSSSEKGYLVSKVIAVDADSGHNSWLSYYLIQVQEPSIFMIGQHTGEIRLTRDFQETDSSRQKIVVMVKDNGEPTLSATVTLNLLIAENFQAVPEMSNKPIKLDTPDVTFYLVIAIAVVSLLFILAVIGTVISKCRKSNSPVSFGTLATDMYPQFAFQYPSQLSDGTLPLPFSYDVCVALDSSQNEFPFLKPTQNEFPFLKPSLNVPTDNLIDTGDSSTGNDSIKEAQPDSGLSQVR
ncbi:protocadherin gamma-B5-like [Xenopus laevis]|uniref:Protocadherin gamma-B5-like n=1 Tax=Xenopus laevis TaxID=8355 RepID=A0A8J1MJ07_XENLA|nr:protocadherin gamma-B5-like [Xenopus laevis]